LVRGRPIRYVEQGPFASQGEDRDLLERLAAMVKVVSMSAPPFLYVYRFHGANTCSRADHEMLATGFCRDRAELMAQRRQLTASARELLVKSRRVVMTDPHGGVFAIE
jgi:hypothetical protein